MSIKIMSLVWENGPQNSTDRFVLLAIADFANYEGTAWPSVTTLAEKCSMTKRTILRAIARLEEQGYLERKRRQRTSNLYQIICDRLTPIDDKLSPMGVTESHQGGDRESLKPSYNHHNESLIEEEETPAFVAMRNMLSELTGCLPTPSDIKAIEQCVSLGVLKVDIEGALQWRKDNMRGPVKTINQLVPGIITNRSMRVQTANAKGGNHRGKKKQSIFDAEEARLEAENGK